MTLSAAAGAARNAVAALAAGPTNVAVDHAGRKNAGDLAAAAELFGESQMVFFIMSDGWRARGGGYQPGTSTRTVGRWPCAP